jgi:hypothetical protein
VQHTFDRPGPVTVTVTVFLPGLDDGPVIEDRPPTTEITIP